MDQLVHINLYIKTVHEGTYDHRPVLRFHNKEKRMKKVDQTLFFSVVYPLF